MAFSRRVGSLDLIPNKTKIFPHLTFAIDNPFV